MAVGPFDYILTLFNLGNIVYEWPLARGGKAFHDKRKYKGLRNKCFTEGVEWGSITVHIWGDVIYEWSLWGVLRSSKVTIFQTTVFWTKNWKKCLWRIYTSFNDNIKREFFFKSKFWKISLFLHPSMDLFTQMIIHNS